MGSRGQLMEVWRPKLKQASLLWLHGFTEALSLHRVVIYCLRSRELAIRTGQCFILNGLIFLGSIFVLKSVIIPTLQWILPDQCPQTVSQEPCSFDGILELYSSLRLGLLQLVYVLWFYPLYIFSFIISSMWYNDIAKYGFLANAKSGNTVTELSSSPKATQTDKPTDLGGVMIGIAEQVYSVLLLNVFFLEFFVTGYIPYIGKMLNFLLLSWMYAYYCFEYKWNFSGLSLDKRLDFFESNWAFFAGFGNPCILAIFFFSPLVSYGVMAILHMQQQDGHAAPPPPSPAVAPLLTQTSWSPDAYRDEAWLRRKGNHDSRRRRSIDLGFGFASPEIDQRLSDTLPALGLYYTVHKQFHENSKSSTTASECDSPSSSVGNHSIFDPGDNPQTVKTRLRQWAQVVACSVRQSSS